MVIALTTANGLRHNRPMTRLRRFSAAILLCLAAIASAPQAWAQGAPASRTAGTEQVAEDPYHPRTGDAWVDRQLLDIDLYAARYPDAFLDELGRYASVPRGYAQALLEQQQWRPGDIYFACVMAQAMEVSCRELVREWAKDHAEGWEGVVNRLEVRAGSLQYRKLRHAIVASYDRWARPIELDALLKRQLPAHGRPAPAPSSAKAPDGKR